jgi:Peptidase inhibitor family I36
MAANAGRWLKGWAITLIGLVLFVSMIGSAPVTEAGERSAVGRIATPGHAGSLTISRAPKAGWADCNDGNVCLYSQQHFSGELVQFSGCCTWIDLADYGFDATTASWRNRRNNDSVLATGQGGNGDHLCLNNNDSDGVMSDAWRNAASSVRNRDVSDLC